MKRILSHSSAGLSRHRWPWNQAFVLLVVLVVMICFRFAEGCPCDPVGAMNPNDCLINTSYNCLCKKGYRSSNCSVCKDGYYRPSPVLPKNRNPLNQTSVIIETTVSPTSLECLECQCDKQGSVRDLGCDSHGNCQCKTGVGGAKCDQCLAGYHSFTDNGCRQCDCMEIAAKCQSAKVSTRTKTVHHMCNQCIDNNSWAVMCNQMCTPTEFFQSDGSCQPCPCKPIEDSVLLRTLDSRQCNIFTGQCLLSKPISPCSKNYRGKRATSNCSLQHLTESTTTPKKNWEKNSTDSYLIAGVLSCFLMLIICIIIIIFIVKRKRRYRRTPMPLWTIELKRDDTCRSSFTDYSDVDVMYLDDSYLMDSPSELFSASTDSINERIGGYHTLS